MISMGKTSAGNELSRRELLQSVIPGRDLLSAIRPVVDRTACSGCALCARDCPNEAITATGDEAIVITFRSDLCDGCGTCANTCPEKCLRLECYDATTISESMILFEDELERCAACGRVIGSKAMVRLIRAKLESRDPAIGVSAGFCPVCKGRKDGDGV